MRSGLFLGYPPDDVAGFIRCGAKCFKCVGDWKVYRDEVEAKRLFARYQACTRCYQKLWSRGRTVGTASGGHRRLTYKKGGTL